MNPTLTEVYSLAFDQAPLVVAAYGILWAALMVYVGMALKRVSRIEKELEVLEQAIARRSDT